MTTEKIRERLFQMQDTAYRDFQSKLIPGKDPKLFIGIRTPALRAFAKDLLRNGDYEEFLSDLPHHYFDENQLHAFIISEIKDYRTCIEETERFLPYIDNWATCDQMSPKTFKKNKDNLLEHIENWLKDKKTYTIRFAIGMLMQHYLDEDFKVEYAQQVAAIRSDEYYVKMMVAWYFATALAKQYDAAIPFLEQHLLDPWTHRKAIQKAVESYRIAPETKQYLISLK